MLEKEVFLAQVEKDFQGLVKTLYYNKIQVLLDEDVLKKSKLKDFINKIFFDDVSFALLERLYETFFHYELLAQQLDDARNLLEKDLKEQKTKEILEQAFNMAITQTFLLQLTQQQLLLQAEAVIQSLNQIINFLKLVTDKESIIVKLYQDTSQYLSEKLTKITLLEEELNNNHSTLETLLETLTNEVPQNQAIQYMQDRLQNSHASNKDVQNIINQYLQDIQQLQKEINQNAEGMETELNHHRAILGQATGVRAKVATQVESLRQFKSKDNDFDELNAFLNNEIDHLYQLLDQAQSIENHLDIKNNDSKFLTNIHNEVYNIITCITKTTENFENKVNEYNALQAEQTALIQQWYSKGHFQLTNQEIEKHDTLQNKIFELKSSMAEELSLISTYQEQLSQLASPAKKSLSDIENAKKQSAEAGGSDALSSKKMLFSNAAKNHGQAIDLSITKDSSNAPDQNDDPELKTSHSKKPPR